jgi:hypothetical protein
MARRSAQLNAEIAAALAKGSPHPGATVSDWKKRIAEIQKRARHTGDPSQRAILQEEFTAAQAGLRAAQQTTAMKPTYVTGINLYALKKLIIESGGRPFSNRLAAVDRPHIKRTLDAGLVEIRGNNVHLTPAGRTAVADEIISDIERLSKYTPRENTFVPAERRAELLAKDVAKHEAELAQLERVLATIHANS